MDIPHPNNFKTQISTSTNSKNEFFKKINTFNLTGINDYNDKNNSNKNKLSPLNSNFNNTNIFPPSTNEEFSQSEKEEKLSFIKGLIKKPKDKPYDGYACFRKKPTINYLIKKFDIKDELHIFEENKLCKIPYPLIKFISNRKSLNKSKDLITDMLSAELNNLSVQQKNDIKYKNYKKPIKITKLKYIEGNNYRRINNFSEPKNLKNNNLEFPYLTENNNRRIINKRYIIDNPLFMDNYSYLNTNRPCYNDRSIKKILMKLYCGDDINLTEHSTFKKNISILQKDVSKKLKIKDDKFNDILKDISILKSNNHIMAFEK